VNEFQNGKTGIPKNWVKGQSELRTIGQAERAFGVLSRGFWTCHKMSF
jgi:hypothetical protein